MSAVCVSRERSSDRRCVKAGDNWFQRQKVVTPALRRISRHRSDHAICVEMWKKAAVGLVLEHGISPTARPRCSSTVLWLLASNRTTNRAVPRPSPIRIRRLCESADAPDRDPGAGAWFRTRGQGVVRRTRKGQPLTGVKVSKGSKGRVYILSLRLAPEQRR